MAKLDSVPLYPVNLIADGLPTNLCLNKRPDGKFEIARVLKPGSPQEGEFEVLGQFENEQSAREFARSSAR